MTVDYSKMHLGKRPQRHDSRTLRMARYLTAPLAPPPAQISYTQEITDWGMMLNDQLGCCVLGDALVTTADAALGYRSRYSGPIITIKCLSGKKLAVTPNHAILTPRGFTPAKLIKQGDTLIGTRRAEIFPRSSRSGSETDLNQAPSPIEKICSSLNSGVNAASKIAPRSVHFHGDGQFIDGDIDVIGTNGLLRSKLRGPLRKPKCQYKISSERLSRNSDLFGRLHDRNPGLISQDRVIDVETNELSTHVYDLSTESGYYVANGIVTHNCTIAATGHAVQVWTANAGKEVTVSDSTVLHYYEQWDGYNPSNPSTDLGGVELDVLNHWHQEGFLGHGLDAYAAIDLGADKGAGCQVPGVGRNAGLGIRDLGLAMEDSVPRVSDPGPQSPAPDPQAQVLVQTAVAPSPGIATAIWLFGGAYIGIQLPIRAQSQDVWDVPSVLGPEDEPGSWGGHAVYVVGYELPDAGLGINGSGPGTGGSGLGIKGAGLGIRDSGSGTRNARKKVGDWRGGTKALQSPVLSPQPPGSLTCITWGQLKKMTWAWFDKYCDEAYALVSCDFIEANGVSPSGFNFATLEEDLKLVTA